MKPLYWLSLITLLFVVGCGGSTSVEPLVGSELEAGTAVSSQTDADVVEYTNSDATFSIALPGDWTTVAATADAFSEMQSTAEQNDALSVLTDDYVQGLIASGLELYAFKDDSISLDSKLPVSIKVIQQSAPVSLGLEELVADTVNQLASIVELTSDIEQSTVRLGDNEAIQLSYSMLVQTAVGTKADVHNTQYYLIHNDQLFIITLEMGQELVDDYLVAGETAVETFRLLGN